jgi:hypothetical protein
MVDLSAFDPQMQRRSRTPCRGRRPSCSWSASDPRRRVVGDINLVAWAVWPWLGIEIGG